MERDPNVFLLGEDIGVYGGAFKVTAGFLEQFGERRVVDTPISESAIVGAAIGASLMGLRPVAEMQFADFITCGFDQIVNFAAKCRYRWDAAVPMVIRAPSGGGIHGGPFHSQNPEMWFVRTPGLKVVAPATAYDAKGLIKSAIRDNDPVLFFEHKGLYRRIKEDLPDGRLHGAHRQGQGGARGPRPHHRHLRRHGVDVALRGGRKAGEGRAFRSRWWTCGRSLPLDRDTVLRQRAQDLQGAAAARGHAHRRHGRRAGGTHHGEGV